VAQLVRVSAWQAQDPKLNPHREGGREGGGRREKGAKQLSVNSLLLHKRIQPAGNDYKYQNKTTGHAPLLDSPICFLPG
jgi:hypothetical protein